MPRKAEIGATRDSYVYQVRVPDTMRIQWDAYCAKHEKKAPQMLRALMRYMINDEMPDEVRRWVAEHIENQPDSGEKKRVVVRLTPTEHKGITERAAAEGCSSQRWIINCVRASLTHQPQFTMDTTKALWESSYQLRSIGRNLNQITKRLHEAGQLPLMVEDVDRLASFIYEHTDKVATLTDASLGRWLIQKNESRNPQ
ncbi:plasmid mobilization protein [Vreelandella titanicae]|uniref:plasmid mobilization protein n=1 Tax=Vreelandella titanicae TaxID=664683 RepID=UPI00114460C2|nr:plasmid mobilization relaxosome protein MobC [Halomonas titanicae]